MKVNFLDVKSILWSLTSGSEMVTYKESFLWAHLTGAIFTAEKSAIVENEGGKLGKEVNSLENHTQIREKKNTNRSVQIRNYSNSNSVQTKIALSLL